MSSLPLFLKLAAASLFGAAAYLSHHKLRCDAALSFQQTAVLRRATVTFDAPPPSILVLGFWAHGKSSFINTVCRVLSGETGPIVLRSETAPAVTPPGSPTTKEDKVVSVVGGRWWEEEDELEEEVVVVEMVDTPGFKIIENVKEEVDVAVARRKEAEVDCVVVVLRCPGSDVKKRIGALKRLADIAAAVRHHGLSMVVVLTHKEAMRSAKRAEELRKEVVVMARTDCVYLIENYTADAGRPMGPINNFETHWAVLAIVRQCMEYSVMHRGHKQREKSGSAMSTPNK